MMNSFKMTSYVILISTVAILYSDAHLHRKGHSSSGSRKASRNGLNGLTKPHPNEGIIDERDYSCTTLTKGGQQKEVRVSYQGIWGVETVIPRVGEDGLYLREVTNGNRLIRAIYQGQDNMVDCDINKDSEELDKFKLKFLSADLAEILGNIQIKHNLKSLQGRRLDHLNSTFKFITEETMDDTSSNLVNMGALKANCRKLHKDIRRTLKEHKDKGENERKKDEEKDGEVVHHRQKRAMFIYPGTNWCGSGNVARSFEHLGDSWVTDKCCRTHDHCPWTIEGFSSKYNMFNYRFHTVSHCNCDESFRSCLKNTGNDAAGMVGSLYFNVVGTKCFVLKKHQTCSKRSWWGKCVKYQKVVTAHLRDPHTY